MYALALILLAATGSGNTPQAPKSGEDVIRAMYQRYAGKWYSTLTFVQTTRFPNRPSEIWYEAARFPGHLRIDIAPLDSGRAIYFRNDSVYQFRGGRQTNAGPFVHPLMVLGFDVYVDQPEKTIAKLTGLHFDLSKIRTAAWQGKTVWVVGVTDSTDLRTNQFWIEQDNLLFVRMLQTNPNGNVSETQFNKYFQVGGGWIAPEVLFFTNGTPGIVEEYNDVKTGVTLPADLFDPARFSRAAWIQ